jgi:hypothetical protein
MIENTEGRWKPDELSRMPTVQLLAIFAPDTTEQDALGKVNKIRARKGLPPITALIGKVKHGGTESNTR